MQKYLLFNLYYMKYLYLTYLYKFNVDITNLLYYLFENRIPVNSENIEEIHKYIFDNRMEKNLAKINPKWILRWFKIKIDMYNYMNRNIYESDECDIKNILKMYDGTLIPIPYNECLTKDKRSDLEIFFEKWGDKLPRLIPGDNVIEIGNYLGVHPYLIHCYRGKFTRKKRRDRKNKMKNKHNAQEVDILESITELTHESFLELLV